MDATHSLINHISQDIYLEMKTALELGRWQSGNVLTDKQRSIAIQAMIAWEVKHLPEHERTAYIHKPEHEACDSAVHHQEQIVKFLG